ncbi:Putative uncharacterized protein [Moritella viscosa]|nr:Putative uncharacterized protein [Moritella viscosa]SHO23646.1 Putative uncharacterized protein [Moritella viscosa]
MTATMGNNHIGDITFGLCNTALGASQLSGICGSLFSFIFMV